MGGCMEINLTIAIDDVNPLDGWKIIGEQTDEWMKKLYKKYGVKFTLFIPSNYHNLAPISQHKKWVDNLKKKPYFELAAHGHYHMTSDSSRFGECEFLNITPQQCDERLDMIFQEWGAVNHTPLGWRNPGWLCQQYCINKIGERFKYAAVHYEHNHNWYWPCQMFFGHDSINEIDISLHNNNCIMFQSHINGEWNKNIWNEENYLQLDKSLEYLYNIYNIKPLSFSELLENQVF